MLDFSQARANMIEGQLRPNRVSDPALLAAVAELPRESFLPAPLKGIAYVDDDIPLGNGRYLIEPMVLCRLLQNAAIRPGDKVLDVGCATGYSSALLARLAAQVIALESDDALAALARQHLAAVANIRLVSGPLERGWAAEAPYDVILVGGTVAQVPAELTDQLVEGGRLLTVIANGVGGGTARLLQKTAGVISSRPLFDAGTPSLPGFARRASFVF
jgi:protein-L-isoaspartate(D-aspartate) O-methyltransferase